MDRTTGQMLTWVAAAVVATLAVMRLVGAGGDGATPPQTPVKVSAGDRGERAGRAGVYVHVAGAVRRPGLYKLSPSARVAAALERAGGPRAKANLAAINLAARVEDGQQIIVPREGGAPGSGRGQGIGTAGAGGAASEPGAAAGSKLSLAGATTQQLEELYGIGPTLAKRIVEYRDSKGGFRSIGQLREVDGIGEKRFEALRHAVSP